MKVNKWNNKKIGILLMLLTLSIPLIVRAQIQKEMPTFFMVDKQQVCVQDIVIMTLDIQEITYTHFLFTLSGDESLQQIDMVDTEKQENLEIQKKDNSIQFEVNKTTLDISKLQLYYEVPDTLKVRDTIVLKAIVTELIEGSQIENEFQNSQQTKEQANSNTWEEGEKAVIEMTLTVVEKDQEKEENQEIEKDAPMVDNHKENASGNAVSNITDKEQTKTVAVMSNSKTTANASNIEETYAGSYDNYLSSIQIEGYTVNPTFLKTNQTYFLTVENSVTQLSIEAITCDERASMQIYGNTNLQEGVNKILIFVTAQNGKVRTYRIYVTREA